MLSTPQILERLYGAHRRKFRERLLRRLRETSLKLGRWLDSQRWGLTIAAATIVILSLAHGYYYNMLMRLESNLLAARARVEAGQQRRNHIKRNLTRLARFYARYEQEMMNDTTKLRTEGLAGRSSGEPADPQKPSAAGSDTMGLLGRLFAVAEQYPNLHLTNTVEQFMNGVVNTESEIAAYIISYNEAVNIYRTAKTTFPAKVFSAVLRFPDYPFYQPEDPKVLDFEELKL